jgi:putative N6-adenine-specific DNA methylase
MNTLNLLKNTRNTALFAQCPKGVEPYLEKEIITLGAQETQIEPGGISFKADTEVFYRILYTSRLAGRLLIPIWSFTCPDSEELYRKAVELPWHTLIPAHRTFMVSCHLINAGIKHTQYASLRLKDAIVDQVRKQCGQRPSVDRERPDLRVNLFIQGQDALISLDPCGPLHQRGYRLEGGMAPLKENLAAAILFISGWTTDRPLLDPFCGSGTFLGEALMMAARIPAGYKRSHQTLKYIPGFDELLWNRVRNEADNAIRPISPGLINGSDIHGPSIRKARHNLFRLPHGEAVSLQKADFHNSGGLDAPTIVTNLPYGERMGEEDRIFQLYRDFGDYLKKSCTGSQAWLLCGSTTLVKHIGLRPKARVPLFNGPIETRLIHLDLY